MPHASFIKELFTSELNDKGYLFANRLQVTLLQDTLG